MSSKFPAFSHAEVQRYSIALVSGLDPMPLDSAGRQFDFGQQVGCVEVNWRSEGIGYSAGSDDGIEACVDNSRPPGKVEQREQGLHASDVGRFLKRIDWVLSRADAQLRKRSTAARRS
jgi:hypothetical protein